MEKSMAGGFMGKILRVDLSKHTIKADSFDKKLERQFLGGYGIGARMLYDEQKAGVDALGHDNTLCFISHPLSGTQAISGCRYVVVAKSPLTGTWGEANSGGSFAAFLKYSGYDAVFFTGISDKPVYLLVNNGRAEIKDATHLWGKDCYDTDDILKTELGKDTSIACIGQAGERLSLVSCIMHNKGSAAGRSGLGAVMGSKKLKAVAVKGTLSIPLPDPEAVKKLRAKYLPQLGGHIKVVRQYGTTFTTVPSAESGDSPIHNWSGIASKDFVNATYLGEDLLDKRKLRPIACYLCPVGCEALLNAGKGEYQYPAGSFRPEYETMAMLGSNCGNNNLESILKANDQCNRYGLDTISTGAIVAFTMDCYEHGMINLEETGGLDLKFGNHHALVNLIDKIGLREGIGDILADGVKKASEKIGRGSDKLAMHVHGQEIPGHNPVASHHVTTTYLTDATPARHTQGSEEHHSDGIVPDFNRQLYTGRGLSHKMGVCFQHALMCTGVCLFVNMTYPHKDCIAEFMRVVTGWDMDTAELITAGERIANMRMAFNLREGVDFSSYKIPDRVVGRPAQKEGPLAGVTVDRETLVKEYLREMDWDVVTGKPSQRKLLELNLFDVAANLYP
jgi:aldehyde:ferredoxin oxidoreductase